MRNISLQKLSKLNRLFIVATLLLGTLGITFAGVGAQSSGSSPSALIIDLDGTINTVATNRVERGLEQAFEEGYNFAIIRIDTPGGTIDATRDIVNLIVDAPLPVITYVAPDGAHAGSAGTFVAAAGHLLVMASVSNIGAASPVSSTGEEIPETLDLKLREDASALLRSIAELRDRNIDALEDTVLNATSYSANEALELGIADFIADSTSSLLTVVDGQTVVVNGLDVTINSVGAALETASFNLFAAFQSIIASPNVAYILLVLGIIGLVLEALFLGGWVAGTIGVILIISWWLFTGPVTVLLVGGSAADIGVGAIHNRDPGPGLWHLWDRGYRVARLGGHISILVRRRAGRNGGGQSMGAWDHRHDSASADDLGHLGGPHFEEATELQVQNHTQQPYRGPSDGNSRA